MTSKTAPGFPIDLLMSCGSCGSSIGLTSNSAESDAVYECQGRTTATGRDCPLPELPASRVAHLIITRVMEAVLTKRHAETAAQAANSTGVGAILAGADVEVLKSSGEAFTRAMGGTMEAARFLGSFIAGIEIQAKEAVVRYSIPLPEDSRHPGERVQHIPLTDR